MFNGSKDLIWSPKSFRLLLCKDLWCGMGTADGRLLRVTLLLPGAGRDSQSKNSVWVAQKTPQRGQKALSLFGQALTTLSTALP